ncbi:peritrophic membrane protein 2 [Plakobranchus ocellatus]|uniref:Peritrophic membrane protein 2 n=1 Tax=Plakobranchus ocellatus TaxID=259542 RepID=A0AAV4AA28_9GAST|nr:peritrophic membrane protein 2 [Plakobranchus ocellatus]
MGLSYQNISFIPWRLIGLLVFISIFALTCWANEDLHPLKVREKRQIRGAPRISCPGAYNVLIQDISDCFRYYQCSNNMVTRMSCPTGQTFSPSYRNCGNYPIPAWCQTFEPGQLETRYRCPQSHGLFQDTSDCSSYYVCTNFSAVRRQCSGSLLFDPLMGVCSDVHNPVGCHNFMTDNMPEQRFGACNELNSRNHDPEDCSNYYVCINYHFQKRSCPSVRCRQMYGQFQDPSDCSSYYECRNWQARRWTCPAGLLFDPVRMACGGINNPGNCQMPVGQVDSRPTWGGQISSSFNCAERDGEFQYVGDCSMFWRCDNFVATPMHCPGRLLFNPYRGYCDWPEMLGTSSPGCRMPIINGG